MIALWRTFAGAAAGFRAALAAWLAGPAKHQPEQAVAPGSIGEWAP